MPELNVGDIALVTAKGTLAGQTILNTFTYRCIDIGIDFGIEANVAMDDLVDAIVDPDPGLHTRLLDVMPSNYTLNYWTAQIIAPVRVYRFTGDTLDSAGASGSAASTANLASVITRRGAFANRRNQGSLHVPYPDLLTETTPGLISAAFLTDLNLLAANMLLTKTTPVHGCVFKPVLYNPGATPAYSDLVAAFAQDTIRVMRRRTVRVGI